MTDDQPVAVVSHDAGGAEFLSSHIRRLPARALLVLEGPAKAVFQRKLGEIRVVTLEEAIESAVWVLCGTSWQSDLELRAIELARQRGKRSVTLLDHWVNYRARFKYGANYLFPDEIWVADQFAEQLVREHIPEARVTVVGNAYLEDMRSEIGNYKRKTALRPGAATVLYICENIAAHAESQYGDPRYSGYVEDEAIEYFLRNLPAIASDIERIIVRPHPSEPPGKYRWVTGASPSPLELSDDTSLAEDIAEADIVVGCESMAMVVALVSGKRVVSCIPPGGRPSGLPYREIESLTRLAGLKQTAKAAPVGLLLATTALECAWGESEPLLFLGEWCKRYERRTQWEARQPVVVPYHWDDRSKLRRDHDYLKGLHDRLLPELAQVLGQYHRLERPLKFWHMLLDPWLSRYLGVIFDRWESLRVAFDVCGASHTLVHERKSSAPVHDQVEFVTAVTNDTWNHELCTSIMSFAYPDRCQISRCNPASCQATDSAFIDLSDRRRGLIWRLVSRIEQSLAYLLPRSDVVFVHPYFRMHSFLRLNLRLRQLPRLYLRDFAWEGAQVARARGDISACRETLLPTLSTGSKFEQFLRQRIGRDVPQVFLELFSYLAQRSTASRLRPRLILTANDHAHNDVFKHWAAHKAHEGVPLVIMDHGGALPSLFGAMKCEEEIATIRTVWPLPFYPKHVRLPANKLVGRKRRTRDGTRLLVIGQEMPRYAFDAHSMPLAGQTLLEFDYVCRLHDALSETVRQAFFVKPNLDMGWRTGRRYIDRLGTHKVCHEPRLEKVWKSARIIVSTYPQTNFSEAMGIGVPVVLVYPRQLYETQPHLDGLLAELCDARIAFFDPSQAAAHLNLIWAEPEKWWESAPVRAARDRFYREAVDVRPDWIEPWVDFIRRHLLAKRDATVADTRLTEARRKVG